MVRHQLIAGNWKMNTSLDEAIALAKAIAQGGPYAAEALLCPPFPWLVPVAGVLTGSGIQLGAQDCWTQVSGAVTGAVSPAMLTGICSHVIVGHSERRKIFAESDELVAAKASAALAHGLTPIVCVGEELSVRQAGGAEALVAGQIRAALSGRDSNDLAKLVIAYEPIWAIGTGVAASADDAQQMAAAIRSIVAEFGTTIAAGMRILYGGSVTPANASEILSQPDVDGALVGGASLKADGFAEIVRAATR